MVAALTALATLDNPAPTSAKGWNEGKLVGVEVGKDDNEPVYMFPCVDPPLVKSPGWQPGNPKGGDAQAGFIRFSFWRLEYSRFV